MSYFEGINFFLPLIVVMTAYIALAIRNNLGKYISLVLSIVAIVFIYGNSKRQLIFLVIFIVLQWLNIMIYLMLRKKYKRNKLYYYAALFISMAPLIINKVTEGNRNWFAFLGVSYISFKAIQMIIEIFDGLIKEVKFVDYISFMTFFPTMSSGPIDRFRRFRDSIDQNIDKESYYNLAGTGLFRFVLGYFYKFVISSIIYYYLQKFANGFAPLRVIGYIYTYGFYLFFDFAGYSLMAVGVGNILGYDIPMNFNKPFISINIKDFWNRWHISLSHWFRDFVFSRIVKNMIKKKITKNMLIIGVFSYIVNMGIMGAWHGLTISYLLYGLYHGILLGIGEIIEQKSSFYKSHKDSKGFKIFSWFVTFNLVMFGFFIFSGRFILLIERILY